MSGVTNVLIQSVELAAGNDPLPKLGVESMQRRPVHPGRNRTKAHLKADDVDLAVKTLLEMMSGALTRGERIEIRGFGSFSLHFRPPRLGRNPKTGESVALPGKHVPHFKPGKELRDRVSGVTPISRS